MIWKIWNDKLNTEDDDTILLMNVLFIMVVTYMIIYLAKVGHCYFLYTVYFILCTMANCVNTVSLSYILIYIFLCISYFIITI